MLGVPEGELGFGPAMEDARQINTTGTQMMGTVAQWTWVKNSRKSDLKTRMGSLS